MSRASVQSPAILRKSDGTGKVGHLYGTLLQRVGVTVDARYDYDFRGDGTDESAKLQAALNAAAYGTLIIRKHDANPYLVFGIVINFPVNIIVHNDTIFRPALAGAGGRVFDIRSSGVKIHGYWTLSGDTITQTQSENTYGIIAQHTSKLYDLEIDGLKFENWYFTDDIANDTSLKVAHCIYVDDVDRVKLKAVVDESSGAGMFLRDIDDLEIRGGRLHDCKWYPLHMAGGISNFIVEKMTIETTNALGSYWGGLMDLMSQHNPKEIRNNIGTVRNCKLRGLASYGSAIRISSAEQIKFVDNDISVGVGSLAADPVISFYRVNTRGTASDGTDNGPCKNISIHGGLCKAASANARVLYLSNEWQTARTPAKRITIKEVECESPDASNYFGAFAQVHGQSGGIENVVIKGNKGSVRSEGQARVVGGIVGFVANNADGKVVGAEVSGNSFNNEGTAVSSADVGCYIGQFVDEIRAPSPNTWDGMFFDVRTVANAGPTIEYFDDDHSRNNVSGTRFLNGIALSKVRQTNESGNTAQRPANGGGRANYVTRFNTQLDSFEYFDGTAWVLIRGQEEGTESATGAELSDITSTINTRNKYPNKVVRNLTNGNRYFSNGALAGDAWVTGNASNTITPSS